ncbi:MAG: hypothetical protein QOG66_2867 [Methylobacteriaceae bacterium]|jgi:hypothetical protein|nr:hypothetical protein [Methylobacteriaceae bacterium]
MRQSSSQAYFETVARDSAVKADYIADPTTTNARLSASLRRLYAPVDDEPCGRLGHLMTLIDCRLSGRSR